MLVFFLSSRSISWEKSMRKQHLKWESLLRSFNCLHPISCRFPFSVTHFKLLQYKIFYKFRYLCWGVYFYNCLYTNISLLNWVQDSWWHKNQQSNVTWKLLVQLSKTFRKHSYCSNANPNFKTLIYYLLMTGSYKTCSLKKKTLLNFEKSVQK